MAVQSDEKWSIEKLSSNNWLTWKFQMRHLLLGKGLWGFVDGTDVLDNNATNEQKREFKQKSQKAFSTLVLAIDASQLYLITSCDEVNEAWNILKSHFEKDTLSNKLFLKKQYFRKEMSKGSTMESHLKEMKEITDRLAAIGAPVSEEDQVVTLLGSLPPSYSTLVTALEARADDVTLNFVQQALINEERKQDVSKLSSNDQDAALLGNQFGSKQRKPIRCYNCGGLGHIQRNCQKRRNFGQHNVTLTQRNFENSDCEAAFVTSSAKTEMGRWLIDSGASSHMTYQKELFSEYHSFKTPEKVCLGDGRSVEALGSGKIPVLMAIGNGGMTKGAFYNALYVPKISHNLFSVRAASEKGKAMRFDDKNCYIYDKYNNICGVGEIEGKLYYLNCHPAEYASVSVRGNIDTWHQRLGHINEQYVQKLSKQGIIDATGQLSFCENCVETKTTRKPFKPVGEIKSSRKLQLVHSDVCGPMETQSIGGHRYFVTFIDDYSRYSAVYFIKRKSEVFDKFKEFEAVISNESGEHIGTLRTDNGGEYLSTEFENYLTSKGIRHELTVPYSPQQNGVAERLNRTLIESAKAMLNRANLPKSYWAEAIATASYVKNRVPNSAISNEETPFQRWYGTKPDLSGIKVFGCTAYALLPESKRQKLDRKTLKLRFVGYSLNRKGYRLYDENSGKIVISRDVVFNERDFGREKQMIDVSKTIEDLSLNEKESDDEEAAVQPRRSERERRPPVRFGLDEFADIAGDNLHFCNFVDVKEPSTIKDAASSPFANQWKAAADEEYNALMENNAWELTELPKGKTAIGCKWVFKIKHDKDGVIERFKGRLVAKGYSQKYGIDYQETFSPVVHYSSIRTLLAFAVQHGIIIHQMDVTTAFLNGELTEDVYMEQPEGYVIAGKENLVCKLRKSIYGLKQSSRMWNKTLEEFFTSEDFIQSEADPCVYVNTKNGVLTVIAVYVDDLIILSEAEERMVEVKAMLSERFRMKDMGELHYCLGINVIQRDGQILLSQKQFVLKKLKQFRLENVNVVATPADCNVRLQKDDGISKPVDKELYQSMVGSLLYLSVSTRPDISQAVGNVCKFTANPTEAHLTAVKRIFRYLKSSFDLTLAYKKSEEYFCCYSDSDWAGDKDDRHSTTGNIFMLGGAPISWLSKKQPIVALSTSEAEYVALCSAVQETVWLRRLLSSIHVDVNCPTTIYEDNQGSIAMAKNPVSHARTKHIDIRFHYIREAVSNGIVTIFYCGTKDMLADILTKPLVRDRFQTLRQLIGMEPLKDMCQ